jgi:hypothetical protein
MALFFFGEIMKDYKPMDFQDSRSIDLSNLNPPEAQMGKKRWGFLMGKTLGKL